MATLLKKKKRTVQIMKFCRLELLPGLVWLANEDVTGDILITAEINTSKHADFVLQSICLVFTHLAIFNVILACFKN